MPTPTWTVTVDPAEPLGPIKPMNAVNNGPAPMRTDQTRSNFRDYAALRIPFARIHDANYLSLYGGPHTCDISAIFPNVDADPDDPAAYDFTLTDEYLANIRKAGTEVFFRLGQSIEHYIKKYHVHPPKDFEKWAAICEHVVAHYNEGWANGFRWNIRYWEIWNEPDGNKRTKDGREGPTWTGTKEQFLELYKVTSLRLKKRFPDIKVGGPAFCKGLAWEEDFVPFCRREGLPLDFYSWHSYTVDARFIGQMARKVRALLDANGYTATESIDNEYNYVRGWSDAWVYSLEVEAGRFGLKSAAFVAAVMCDCQSAPLDMLMYYDARLCCGMNGMFHALTFRPLKGYYPFYAWAKLRTLGTQVAATIDDAAAGDDAGQLFVCAAKGTNGRHALLVVRYAEDNNVVCTREVALRLPVQADAIPAHVTDDVLTYTETPLPRREDGAFSLLLPPRSFALIEW